MPPGFLVSSHENFVHIFLGLGARFQNWHLLTQGDLFVFHFGSLLFRTVDEVLESLMFFCS